MSGTPAHNSMYMRMNVTFAFLVALSIAAIVAGLLKPASQSANENETCWSCGLRGSHKLWCPNR